MKFFLKTYGCQMNASDSDAISLYMTEAGFPRATDIKEAGIIILNTCSVRQLPEQKAYSFLGRVEPLKKANPSIKVIVVGCMAQRAGKEIIKRFRFVDVVIGSLNISRFGEIMDGELENWQLEELKETLAVQSADPAPAVPGEHAVDSHKHPVSAFVTIMRGCENFCSYCVVPFVRGPEQSRPAGEIIKEIEGLAASGVKDVTLLGQNVNSYKDRSKVNGKGSQETDFPELLEKINAIKDIERIRFMTSHPKDLSDKLIDTVASLKNLCSHIHLPLQSGSDAVLKRMNRSYTAAHYLATIEKIRNKIPEANITTDILVGFPGETEEDIKATLEVIKAAEFDSLFAFKYSKRPGTESYKFDDSVTLAEKEERLDRVLELGNMISTAKNAKLINTLQEVLVESGSGGFFEGRTRENKKVSFESGIDMFGKLATVKIIEVKINSLSGKLEQVLR